MKRVLVIAMMLFSMTAYANDTKHHIETTEKKTSNRILSIFDPDPNAPLFSMGTLPKHSKDFPFRDVPVGSFF